MPPVAAVASSILAPAVGEVVGGIVGDIGANLLSGGQNTNPLNLLGGISQAFGKLFGQQGQSRPSIFPQLPLPFSPFAGLPLGNPLSILQNSLGSFENLIPGLNQLVGAFGGAQGLGGASGYG